MVEDREAFTAWAEQRQLALLDVDDPRRTLPGHTSSGEHDSDG